MASDSTVRISTTQPITVSTGLGAATVIQCAEAAAMLLHVPAYAIAAQVITYYSSNEAAGTYVKMKYYQTDTVISQTISEAGMYSTPAELFAAKFIKIVSITGSFAANAIMKT